MWHDWVWLRNILTYPGRCRFQGHNPNPKIRVMFCFYWNHHCGWSSLIVCNIYTVVCIIFTFVSVDFSEDVGDVTRVFWDTHCCIRPPEGPGQANVCYHSGYHMHVTTDAVPKRKLPQDNQIFYLWHFSLYQRPSSEEACSVLPVLATIETEPEKNWTSIFWWRSLVETETSKVKMSGCVEVIFFL